MVVFESLSCWPDIRLMQLVPDWVYFLTELCIYRPRANVGVRVLGFLDQLAFT